jgi:hypothetical protein
MRQPHFAQELMVETLLGLAPSSGWESVKFVYPGLTPWAKAPGAVTCAFRYLRFAQERSAFASIANRNARRTCFNS